jgi:hypothetical protein
MSENGTKVLSHSLSLLYIDFIHAQLSCRSETDLFPFSIVLVQANKIYFNLTMNPESISSADPMFLGGPSRWRFVRRLQ